MSLPIIIPSHNRPLNLKTHKKVEGCIVCIPEAQYEDYKRHKDDVEIITHPDDIIGLSAKRQWIWEKFGDHFEIDDDLLYVRRLYLPAGSERKHQVDPHTAKLWINDLYMLAKEMDVKLFGFSPTSHPMVYNGDKPFEFNKFIRGGTLGLIWDEKLWFPKWPHFTGEDSWINLLNAYHYRKGLLDMRLSFYFDKEHSNHGGCSEYRSPDTLWEDYVILRKYFGESTYWHRLSGGEDDKMIRIPF
ncbi:MAG: hypothetical protein ACOC4Y_01495 [bacterium]